MFLRQFIRTNHALRKDNQAPLISIKAIKSDAAIDFLLRFRDNGVLT
jgi:hypothetical protein